jgi:AraC-like DNA-binding protein
VQSDFDLWYIAGGSGEALVDGRWVPFQVGDLLTLPPGCAYMRERCSAADPFRVYFAHVAPFGREEPVWDRLLAESWPLKLPMGHRVSLRDLFERLFEAYTTRPADYESLAVRGLVLQILDIVFAEVREQRSIPARAGPHGAAILARDFIDLEFHRPLLLADIATAAGVSSSHLGALFRTQFGVSPVEYLLRVRIRAAKLLLARGKAVKTVAYETGFGSSQQLCRTFRARTGQTPGRFARSSARR